MVFVDLSFFTYFVPLLSFLVVFLISFAVLQKANLFDSKFWQIFVAFLVAVIFVSAVGPTEYISVIIPWFAIFVVAFVLILALLGFAGVSQSFPKFNSGVGIAFVIGLLLIFLVSGIFVFSSYISPYLPWNSGYGGNTDVLHMTNWLYAPRVYGALLLLVISGLVSWFLAKSKK
jgi:hypothetical protein